MKKRLQLSINVSEINAQQDDNASIDALESTYRAEGLSIGKNYMRFEGSMLESSPSPEDFIIEEIIGQGVSSVVKRARLSESSSILGSNGIPHYFALKICPLSKEANRNSFVPLSREENDSSQQQQYVHKHRAMFLQEMKTLCRMRCDSLVSLIGGFYEPGISVTMVLEYMDRGSLADLLRMEEDTLNEGDIDCGGSVSSINNGNFNKIIPEFALSSIAYQILLGISYLHSENVIHRDLKPGMFQVIFFSHLFGERQYVVLMVLICIFFFKNVVRKCFGAFGWKSQNIRYGYSGVCCLQKH